MTFGPPPSLTSSDLGKELVLTLTYFTPVHPLTRPTTGRVRRYAEEVTRRGRTGPLGCVTVEKFPSVGPFDRREDTDHIVKDLRKGIR